MDRHQQLNHRQFMWMIVSILVGGGYLTVPQALIQFGETDAWLSEIIGLAYALVVGFFFVRLVKLYPGKNIFEINLEVGGKLLGAILNGLLIFYLWSVLVRDLAGMEQIIKTTLLRNTPENIVMLVFIGLVMFYGRTSVEITARVADLILPLFISFTFTVPFLLLNEISLSRIQPVMVMPIKHVLTSNVISLGQFADFFVVGAFLHTLSAAKKLHASLRLGILLSAFWLTLVTLMDLTVLGGNIAAKELLPSYSLIQQIHITDFLDRIDIIVFSIWLPVFTIKVVFIFLALLLAITSFGRTKDSQLINRPVAWFLLLSTVLSFSGVQELFAFSNYSLIIIALTAQLPVIAIVWILSAKKHSSSNDGRKAGPNPKLRKWSAITHILLLSSLGGVVIGFWLGKDFYMIANICGSFYFLTLMALIFTTYKEVAAVRDR